MINERLTIERLSEILKNMQGYAARDRQLSEFVGGCAIVERVDPTFIDCVTALTELLECRKAQKPVMFIDGDISPSDAEKLAAAIREFGSEPAELFTVESPALRDVAAERQRQITAEGWTPEHDDEHENGQLAAAAACYALFANMQVTTPAPWPWSLNWWKQSGQRRDLVKAGALILAEIERIDRSHKEKSNE